MGMLNRIANAYATPKQKYFKEIDYLSELCTGKSG